MSNKRRQHSAALKTQVRLEALKNIDPMHAIAAKHTVHPAQVDIWKKEVAGRLPEIFTKSAVAVAALDSVECRRGPGGGLQLSPVRMR